MEAGSALGSGRIAAFGEIPGEARIGNKRIDHLVALLKSGQYGTAELIDVGVLGRYLQLPPKLRPVPQIVGATVRPWVGG